MTEFANCLTLDELTADELCSGFGGCDSAGMQATSQNLNRAFAYLQSLVSTSDNDGLRISMPSANVLELKDGATILATVTLPSASTSVPPTRIIQTNSPLRIDGSSSANLTQDRILSLDLPALIGILDGSFVNPNELANSQSNLFGIASDTFAANGQISFNNGLKIKVGTTFVNQDGNTPVTYVTPFTTFSKAFSNGYGESTLGQAAIQSQAFNCTAAGFEIRSGSNSSFSADWFAIGI